MKISWIFHGQEVSGTTKTGIETQKFGKEQTC